MTLLHHMALFFTLFFVLTVHGGVCSGAELYELDDGWQYRYGDSPVNEQGIPRWIQKDIAVHWHSFSPPFNPPERNNRDYLWLKKSLPAVQLHHPTLYLANIVTDFQVYCNGELIYSSGSFNAGKRNRYHVMRWHLIPVEPDSQNPVIYFRIFSTDEKYIGIPIMADNKALYGSHSEILGFVVKNGLDRFVLGCFFMILGIFSMDAFMHRLSQKPYYLLSFGIFAFFVGLAFTLSNDLLQFVFDCSPVRYYGSILGVVLFPVGFFSFFEYIVLEKQKRTLRTMWQVLLAYGLMVWTLDLLHILHYDTYLFAIWVVLFVLGIVVSIAAGIPAVSRRSIEARLFYFGFIIAIGFVIYDFLFIFQIIPYWRWMSHWGVLFFVLVLEHIISIKNTKDQVKLEKYSLELEQYSDKLEAMVGERTKNLEQKNVQLQKAFEKLRQTQQHLIMKEKMASLGHLVAGIAHEINNPIGAVNSASNVLQRALGRIREKIRRNGTIAKQDIPSFLHTMDVMQQNSDIIKTGSQRVSNLVESLKKFARLDEAEFQNADIREGLDSTLQLLHHKMKDRIEVVRDYQDIPRIKCYPNELNQVFMNLLVNATEAIREKGKINIKVYEDDDFVVVEMSDTGSGISSEHLEKIFDPGFTTKGVGVGTGLGLSISYNIIEKHQGKMSVYSVFGKGTTFRVLLPINVEKT